VVTHGGPIRHIADMLERAPLPHPPGPTPSPPDEHSRKILPRTPAATIPVMPTIRASRLGKALLHGWRRRAVLWHVCATRGEGSRIAENRRRKLERHAVLAQVRGPIELPGERGNREKIGKGAGPKRTNCPSRPQASFGRNDPSPNSCVNEGLTSEAMPPPALDDFFNSSVKLHTPPGPDFVPRSTRGRKSRCDLNSKVLFFR
jgi:hypothetical protein